MLGWVWLGELWMARGRSGRAQGCFRVRLSGFVGSHLESGRMST